LNRHIPLIASETMTLSQDGPFTSPEEEINGVFFRIKIANKTGRSEKASSKYYYST
jgi:hypothetical protein